MRILTFDGKEVNCEPTQKALEKSGISTYNRMLKIKENVGYLIPVTSKYGGGFALDDEPKQINYKFNLFNIFKLLKDLKYNQDLLNFKLKEQKRVDNYILPIEIIET